MKNSYKFFCNKECEFFPCHKSNLGDDFNCLFCYCPYFFEKECPGTPTYKDKGDYRIKVCTDCIYPHVPSSYDQIMLWLRERVKEPVDE